MFANGSRSRLEGASFRVTTLTVAFALATAAGTSARTASARGIVAPAFATATYAIRSVGAPPSTYSSFTAPTGFNTTDQLVGNAQLVSGSQYEQCIAYTGRGWVDVLGAPSLACYTTSGISDANSSGVFKTVGGTYVPTNSQQVAFYATVGPTSSTAVISSSNATSELDAMNESGTAVGYSYYNPVAGFATNQPPVISTGGALALLQPQCTKSVAGCENQPVYNTYQSSQARAISKTGIVLASATNTANGAYVEYTTGSKPSYVQFTLPSDNNYGANAPIGLDDQGNVPYYQYHSATNQYLAHIYSPKTKSVRTLPTLSGNSCTEYIPIYVNGPGRVLGHTANCSYNSDNVYWTWDATNGIVAIDFSHSGYSSATPYVINDLGQISVDLYTSSYKHQWGYLTPPTKL